ncbi:kinesin-related protein 4-like [Macrosteles quadrilineatus]|uniref:kinesin-related protein 4-like n=1 Tax=Macrosteles quadrilineatus TaxID=74068 RepID=UPI0023E319DC|nr:kinesin-related protein 4-like [Macrosteles quadrilineatus]
MSKIHNLREKLQDLDNNFEKWGKTINPMLGYKNELEDMVKQLKLKLQMKEDSSESLEKENNYYVEAANKALLELQERKEQEKTELCQLKTHLSKQFEQIKQQEMELVQELRELLSACREEEIKINIVEPQRVELKKTFETLKMELAAETDQINSASTQLETELQDELNRKIEMSTEINTLDKNITELENTLIELENDIKRSNDKNRQLNADEEEYSKTSIKKQQELKELETDVEDLTAKYSVCMKIETENVTLRGTCDDLNIENKAHVEKITELSSNEEELGKNILELNQLIADLENENVSSLKNVLVLEEDIHILEEEERVYLKEHEKLSLDIQEISAKLQETNNLLKTSCQDLSMQFAEASKTKTDHQETLTNLEIELAKAEDVSKESDLKLFNFYQERESINKACDEEMKALNEDMDKSVEEYEKLVFDLELNEKVKEDIHQLNKDLENYRMDYDKTVQQLQEAYAREIENKKKWMEELRAQCEREYRNNEIKKTDALVELKETKARIIDLQKQKAMAEKEIVAKADLLKKCDNLIQRLMMKFSKVAQVAVTSSQSVIDTASQAPSFATPRTQKKPVRVASPGSDSSGKTFDPDDVNLKIRLSKRPLPQAGPKHAKAAKEPKKKNAPPPPKKMATKEADDWGFEI